MTQIPNPQATPPAGSQPRRRSPFFPALITLGCAALLTGGSLFGFVSTCGNFPNTSPTQPVNTIFGWATLGACTLLFASILWLFVLAVWTFLRARKEDA